MQRELNVVVEGITDQPIVEKILQFASIAYTPVRVMGGKSKLVKNLPKYNQAARFGGWLVVVDLDGDVDCAPAYVKKLIPVKSDNLLLRIAVREVESWLLADAEHLAKYLGIAINKFPHDPDLENNPKVTLIQLARLTRNKRLREDIIPPANSTNAIGPGYPTRIAEFVRHVQFPWRPDIAVQHSDSLHRCISALENWRDKP